jgi:S1-C subfamily serine protease
VGEFGPHAAAKKAGFLKGDVIVEFDGRAHLTRESDVLLHGVTARRPGDRVPVTVWRDGRKLTLTIPMQP